MPETGRHTVENPQYAAFLRRAIRAYTRRIATGDIEALTDLQQLADELHQATTDAVHALREHGYSWADIANRLGVTRQAAHQRYANHPPTRQPDPGGH